MFKKFLLLGFGMSFLVNGLNAQPADASAPANSLGKGRVELLPKNVAPEQLKFVQQILQSNKDDVSTAVWINTFQGLERLGYLAQPLKITIENLEKSSDVDGSSIAFNYDKLVRWALVFGNDRRNRRAIRVSLSQYYKKITDQKDGKWIEEDAMLQLELAVYPAMVRSKEDFTLMEPQMDADNSVVLVPIVKSFNISSNRHVSVLKGASSTSGGRK